MTSGTVRFIQDSNTLIRGIKGTGILKGTMPVMLRALKATLKPTCVVESMIHRIVW